ncbi:MAG: SAM-dependent methyltransferase [Zetaproteobacteria bacterium CG12_big_fil_rev_8_21_14_0_65_55_1124]|nr:MAG: SAM-dependent methyltransferase [Zetaproteobacteria bacterium CG1_02_55_237]PIS20009.1 MAG: SAM-dependent methyltransferase [Zetaproteobacteria bacterium CG08_land_8_20_14_0_20_55_17]PIW43570.1 MAG: SAM-dependent methyltransferase [Zetaproteobacteria bacterium CG12_big_fil_rev_8_21_14_0_65_55_1124]PIY52763.1 MAG: SAM-dependent methyltransferase [Zetaproteobacteria bacterium CG_4_10_14_0_8_um_filter_55_43]PIZ37947.1 MAG: SAM-dependent methyltransferase [Zetaproteobacteria bacterium CG_4_
MDAEQRQFLIERHHGSIALHGYSPHALFWTSRGLQKIRFKVISEIGIAAGDSLLDVGCGFADLQSWLLGHNIPVVYTGLDLSPEMISAAEKMHPKAVLLCGELFDFEFAPASFDWLVLSGTLNWQLNDGGEYARRVIARMYELCRHGLAFNMLNASCRNMPELHDLVAFEPEEMLAFCREISPDCRCRTDYLENDFTIYMRKSA